MKKKISSAVTRWILIALVAILLGISVYNFNASVFLGNELPMPFGMNFLVVLSGSMEPELSPNDLVLVRETDEFREKQIVVFQSGNILVVHRIIALDENTVTTKGDANSLADDPISKDVIKGEVIFSIPYVGILIRFLKKPFVVCLLLAAAVFLMERSFIKEKSKERAELEDIESEIKELIKELKNDNK